MGNLPGKLILSRLKSGLLIKEDKEQRLDILSRIGSGRRSGRPVVARTLRCGVHQRGHPFEERGEGGSRLGRGFEDDATIRLPADLKLGEESSDVATGRRADEVGSGRERGFE